MFKISRSFSRADEYLYAMKEDLAEWLNILYLGVDIDADNFMNKLETGELLVKVGQASIFRVVFHNLLDIFLTTSNSLRARLTKESEDIKKLYSSGIKFEISIGFVTNYKCLALPQIWSLVTH